MGLPFLDRLARWSRDGDLHNYITKQDARGFLKFFAAAAMAVQIG
jgi:hypothetical protein